MSQKAETQTKITKQYLKSKTKEFDLGCIFSLNLSSLGIFDLGCINECTGLVMLDLSNNNISNASLLAPLKQLQVLNLTNNRIASIGGIDELDALSSLDLSSNFIGSIDSLRPLTRLEKFAHLRLSDIGKGLSNPVCQNNVNYKKDIMELLPGLTTLDGQILRGKGSEFIELCQELDTKLEEIKSETMSRPHMTLVKEEYPKVVKDASKSGFKIGDNLKQQEKMIEDLLRDCNSANTKAESTVAALQDCLQGKS